MTCQELSDRMPAVARGTAEWSTGEAEHLRACADCRAEWAVVSAGVTVGQDVALDAEALAGRVLHRLRTEPAVTSHVRTRWLAGVAAVAAAVALILVPAGPPGAPTATSLAPYSVDIPGLDALGAEGLADVLESLDMPWTETSTTDAPTLDDLDSQELERVGRSWEI